MGKKEVDVTEISYIHSIWACGEGLDKPSRKDGSLWSGRNILGFALMEVRKNLD